MGAPMESILNGYEDPRREIYFATCQNEQLAGEYRGIRQGTCFAHDYYNTLSKLKVTQQTDAVLMPAAEVCRSCVPRLPYGDGPMSRRKPAMKKG